MTFACVLSSVLGKQLVGRKGCIRRDLMRQAAGDGLPAFMSFLSWSELPWFWWGTQHFAWAMALVVLVLLDGIFGTGFSWTMLALPLILLPHALLLLGLAWLVSALSASIICKNARAHWGQNWQPASSPMMPKAVAASMPRR